MHTEGKFVMDKHCQQIIKQDIGLSSSGIEKTAEKQAPPEWKVYFEGSFWGHHGRDHSGTEIQIGRQFQWAGRQWMIPAVYSCGKGLVIDFCMRVETEEIKTFIKKWNLSLENDTCECFTEEQQLEMELDNPLCLDFNPQPELNGRQLQASHSCAVSHNPFLPEGAVRKSEAKRVISHYNLSSADGWTIYRKAFSWGNRRRPKIKTLSLTMKQRLEAFPGPHFRVSTPGDTFSFTHPANGQEYTLTVQEIMQQAIEEKHVCSDKWEYPANYTVMSYTLSPEPEEAEGGITVSDCEDSDKPEEKGVLSDSFVSTAGSPTAAIGMIGGADGPTAVIFGSNKRGKIRTAYSALHFSPVQDIEWRITFHRRQFKEGRFSLLPEEN